MTAPCTITAQHWAQQTPTWCRTVYLHASLQTSQGTEPHLSTHIRARQMREHPSLTIPTTSLQAPCHAHPSESVLVILPRSPGELTQTRPGGAVRLESGRPPDGSECLCAVAAWTLRTADSYTNTSFTWYWPEKKTAIYSKVSFPLMPRSHPRCSPRLLIAILF